MTILSSQPDGFGFYYGFLPCDHRQINVRREAPDFLWRAYVGGELVGSEVSEVFETKALAEAAAIAWAKEHEET